MTTDDLRERIETAVRSRASDASVRVIPERRDSLGVNDPCAYATWGEVEVMATGATEADALAALAEAMGLNADGTDPRTEIDQLDALLARQHAILTGVADALRGDPGPLASHSHHDLAERAVAMVAERDAARADAAALRAVAREYLSLRDAVAAHHTMARLFTDYAEFMSAIDKLTVARDALRAAIGGAS